MNDICFCWQEKRLLSLLFVSFSCSIHLVFFSSLADANMCGFFVVVVVVVKILKKNLFISKEKLLNYDDRFEI
jgi:hypothetical protein